MIKNIFFLLCMTVGIFSMQSCIKKKETPTPTAQRPAANNAGAAAKQRQAQAARQKAAANMNKKRAGGYWPSLRKHLGIDFAKMVKLKANESKRLADLAKAGADATAVNAKYNDAAKALLGPALYTKMQSFTMK